MAHTGIKLILLPLVASLIVACNNNGTRSSANGLNPQFDSFKRNFASADLPLTIKGCYVDPSKFVKLDKEKYPVYLTNDGGYDLSWCTFKTNGDYTALFSLGAADCYLPVLTTYDKNGQKIDEKTIAIGGCGADCGFTCEEYMILNVDYSIYTSDTITTFQCDTAGYEIPGTREHYVIYKKGKLLSSGKIELTDEIKEAIKD